MLPEVNKAEALFINMLFHLNPKYQDIVEKKVIYEYLKVLTTSINKCTDQ